MEQTVKYAILPEVHLTTTLSLFNDSVSEIVFSLHQRNTPSAHKLIKYIESQMFQGRYPKLL